MTLTDIYINLVNRTCRSAGAVGFKALVPRHIRSSTPKSARILDFGAGKDAIHAETLKADGYNVTAHDIGANYTDKHCPRALDRTYDVVYASNVLNVQPSIDWISFLISEMKACLEPNGRLVVNYPASPRKSCLTAPEVRLVLLDHFRVVEQVNGTKQAPVWECRQ